MSKTCPICAIVQSPQDNIIVATKYWRVALSGDQGYLGRTYVTAFRHVGTLSELTADQWQDFQVLVKQIESLYKRTLGATLFNWSCLLNNAYQVSPAEPHVHWHLRPRYDAAKTLNGVVFEDPLFGYHYDREQANIVDAGTLKKITDKVRSGL